jgi:hypothetical protein
LATTATFGPNLSPLIIPSFQKKKKKKIAAVPKGVANMLLKLHNGENQAVGLEV